jgi:hypothetical protein
MMEQYADIEGPVRIGLLGLVGLAGLVILVGLVGLVGLLLWRRRKELRPAAVERQRSPLEQALERLEQLRRDASGMAADPFVVEVSDVVRDYLERVLEIPAREQTSEEFLQALQSASGLPAVLNDSMQPFLTRCDLVKFARQALADEQRSMLLDTAGNVIRETDKDLTAAPAEAGKEVAAV